MGQKWVELAISKEATKDAEEEEEENEDWDICIYYNIFFRKYI